MRLFFIAFQFLTIIPLPFRVSWHERDMGRSMGLFPLVGLALGGVLALGHSLCSLLFPVHLADLLVVTLLAVMTGCLHLDGLADVCDGFGARGGRERFLAVMKDSSVGAMGVVGVVLGLMLKYQAVAALPVATKIGAMVLFPAVARFGQVAMTAGSRRARADGLGAAFIAGVGRVELLVAGVIVFAAAAAILGASGVFCCIITTVFVLLARSYFHRRLGGVTGDIIGCVSELSEIVFLLTVVAASGWQWRGVL
jgi:adenosylcobinamide-GDP ribazoletransferase